MFVHMCLYGFKYAPIDWRAFIMNSIEIFIAFGGSESEIFG